MFNKTKRSAVNAFTFPFVIWKPLLLALSLGALSACGSSDEFPASSQSQEPDPLVVDVPLFYIERPLRAGQNGGIAPDDLQDPLTFHGNAKLIMKVRADQSATSIDISARAVPGNVDVRDLDVSHDGRYVVFSLRAPQIENADEEDQPTWNLWEYDIVNDQVRKLISSNILAENGHDITPRYLPDGRIIFASTRQEKSRALLIDGFKPQFSHLEEDRRQPALNLHIYNPKATGEENDPFITQVTFNQSHDFYPTVLTNGKVVFTRWENFANNDALSLYEMNPDGTELQLLYGHHSQGTGAANTRTRFIRSSVMPDGELFAMIRPDETTFYGGNFVRIDTERYIDNTRTVAGGTGSGPAQTPVTDRDIVTDGTLSRGGYYSAFIPLWDNTNRAIVGWSRCRITLNDTVLPCNDSSMTAPGATAAPPAYGIWIFDYANNTQIPIITGRSGIIITDIALATPRFDAPNLQPTQKLPELVADDKQDAAIHIRDVFDFDGIKRSYGNLAPAYLKIIKAVSEPPANTEGANFNSANNAGGARMREIVGYAPIELDGSVKVKVPSDVALSLSIVDANGKALRYNGSSGEILRHNNWITLRPGEVMECKGCHTQGSTAPHGRYNAQAPSTNPAPLTIAQSNASTGIPSLDHNLINHPEKNYPTDPAAGSNPTDRPCLLNQYYSSGCPTIINYPDHIQSIWERERGTEDSFEGIAVLAQDGVIGTTCIRCHSADYMKDPNNAAPNPNSDISMLPPTQLELTNQAENGVRYRSYFELLFGGRPFQVVVTDAMTNTGSLVNCDLVTTPVLDENNDPVLDDDGNAVVTNACPDSGTTVAPVMSTNGAHFSGGFFAQFEGTGSHVGYLTPAELKLIAEWLDIGAQYYNNHFDAPDN